MSDRLCQFFLRGRCQRENCEFKHEKPSDEAAVSASAGQPVPVCHLFLTGSCKAGTSCRLRHEKPEKPAEAKTKEGEEELEDMDPVVAKKSDPPPMAKEADMTSDASTFIAATSDMTYMPSHQLKRKGANPGDKEENNAADPAKEIRRDSKGFENFDDYFDSDVNDSTVTQDDKSTNDTVEPSEAPAAAEEEPAEEAPQENEAVAPEEEGNGEEAFTTVPAPTETMPEEILDGAKEAVETYAEPKKSTLADLSKQWDDDEEQQEQQEAQPEQQNEEQPAEQQESEGAHQAEEEQQQAQPEEQQQQEAPANNEEQETIENIENFIGSSEADKEPQKQETVKKTGNSKEEWVTVIFGEDGKQIAAEKAAAEAAAAAAAAEAASAGAAEKSVYDLDDEDFSTAKAKPFVAGRGRPKKSGLAKVEGVTRIGNNTYYYTGEKQDPATEGAEGETEDDEELEREGDEGLMTAYDSFDGDESRDASDMGSVQGDVSGSGETTPGGGKKRAGRGYAQGRRKHNTNYVYGAKSTAAKTRRCGECEGCNREDCGKCPACQDKPRFGGRGAKKQACMYRICTWKNPSGKRITPQTPNSGSTPKGVPAGTIVSPAAVRRVTDGPNLASTPKDEASETPKMGGKRGRGRGRKSISVVSPAVESNEGVDEDGQVVKKGDSEYMVVVTGVKDTGLTGKYWSDIDKLPSRRRCTITPPPGATPSPTTASSPQPPKGTKRPASADEEAAKAATPAKRGRKPKDSTASPSAEEAPEKADAPVKSPRGRKRKGDSETSSSTDQPELSSDPAAEPGSSEGSAEDEAAKSNGVPAQRNISCLSDANVAGSSQREVVVECFAPYDDHRWVNIGKEKNGMAPDAVQYARALRPPYQLLSFLRIKGNCAKGMGCSNKNTMVFVVLEGEITVVIHTTQFTAKKGDSFYIPPKNYYNLINNTNKMAELSLLQYQYSGPLPSVPAGSQSGGGATNGVAAQN